MQRKSFDFLFYKRQNARIFAQNLPESCGLNYDVYRADALFVVENPVEKVENLMENLPFSSQKRWKTRWKK